MTNEESKTMYTKMIVSMLVAAASLASATTFAAPTDNEVRVEASATKVATEDGKTRYWSHPRLGMIKVDAAGRMLAARSNTGEAEPSGVLSGIRSSRVR